MLPAQPVLQRSAIEKMETIKEDRNAKYGTVTNTVELTNHSPSLQHDAYARVLISEYSHQEL